MIGGQWARLRAEASVSSLPKGPKALRCVSCGAVFDVGVRRDGVRVG